MRREEAPVPAPPGLLAALDARRGRLGSVAAFLRYYRSVGSTNDVAGRLAAAGAPGGATVVAEAQERGRGRMGRAWFSPPGAGLYVSLLLRPAGLCPPDAAPRGQLELASSVTLAAGVAIAEAVREVTGLPAEIKWPNDIVAGRRKLCGILAEASAGAAGLEYVVLGFGVNVSPASYPAELAGRATSIEEELGRAVDGEALLAECLARLAEGLGRMDPQGYDDMLRRWSRLSPSSFGRNVEALGDAGSWEPAATAGIDRDGALLVRRGGATRRVIAGEIRWP